MGHSGNRPIRAESEPARLSRDEISDALNAAPAAALAYIMPDGYLDGREFRCGDVFGKAPSRKGGGTFKFNIDKLTGSDFSPNSIATKNTYGGVLDVYVVHHHGNFKAARATALAFLGQSEDDRKQPRQESGKRGKIADDAWTQIFPAPAIPPDFKSLVWEGYQLSCVWPYNSADGKTLFYVLRMDKEEIDPKTGEVTTRKVTPVVSYGYSTDGRRRWRTKGKGQSILFGLDELAKRPAAPVLVVEGEKAATAARALFPDWVVACWKGGCGTVESIDFTPLRGRIVYLLADADDEGIAAMEKAQKRTMAAGAFRVTLTKPPQACWEMKKGWDLADPMPEGWTVDRIRAHILGSNPFPTDPPPKPYWPATDVDGTAAFAELQIIIEDWMTRTEQWLEARDYAADQRNAFIHPNMSKAEKRETKRHIEQETRRRYPGFDAKRPPRLQAAAAAGLGKSSGLREAYLRHPKLWSRQFHGFLPTVALARGFERDMKKAMVGMIRRPLVALHRGRDHEAEIGNAPCVRWRAGQKLAGKVPSLFSAMCQRGESQCQHYNGCPYIDSYLNQAPGMHLFVHDHLNKSKPLNFPKADFAFIDEDSTQTLLTFAEIGASVLAEPKTYETAKLTNEQDDAATLGARLLIAVTNGTPMLAAIRAAGISKKDMATLAKWATPEDNDPGISPSMSDKAIEEIAEKMQPHNGDIVGRILRQLASEMRHPRDDAIGVGYHNGVLQLTRHSRVTAVPRSIPLIIIDADADLMTNRRLFGDTMVGREVKARRLGRFVQVKNATLAKSYIAPEVSFKEPSDRQVEQAKALRARILEWIAAKAEGKKVLVVTNKPVRTVFTGEGTGKISVSVEFGGATWTHYGAILGIDDWKHFDVVILLGREEMSAGSAERQARAICCNDAEPLILTGEYRKATRCHRMRDGSAVPVDVYEHEDPRVQIRTEAKRERGMCQAIDRLRLIHGRPDREIFILCNLPLPGVEVDELMSLDDLLSGGIPLQLLMHRVKNVWGVLPLVPSFLVENAYDIAPSVRTANRLIAEFKCANPQLEFYLSFGTFKSAKFWLPKQRRPSTVAFFSDVPNGTSIAALERLVGPVTVQISSDTDQRETAPAPSHVSTVAAEVPAAAVIEIDPAAFEPDEPIVVEAAAAGRSVELCTDTGIAEAVQLMRAFAAATAGHCATWGASNPEDVVIIADVAKVLQDLDRLPRVW